MKHAENRSLFGGTGPEVMNIITDGSHRILMTLIGI